MKIKSIADHLELVGQIAKWHWDEWGYVDPNGSLESWTTGLSNRTKRDQIPTTYIALTDNNLLMGSVTLVDNDMSTHPELRPGLAGLYVHPKYRNQGIGTALTNHLIEKVNEIRIPKLYLYTAAARPFYENLGWKTIGEEFYEGKNVFVMEIDIIKNEY